MRQVVHRCAGPIALLAAVLVPMFVACDTGDGKTLRDTVVPTTLPPPDTAPLDSQSLGSAPLDREQAATTSELVVPTTTSTGLMSITAPWLDGAPIDEFYTCDGEDVSPAISWRDLPEQTVELALVVVDDDALDGGEPFVHWAVAGIDPETITLFEDEVPVGAVQATNSFGDVGWGGPCPPVGEGVHDYRFTMHALGQQVELDDGVPASEMIPYLEALTIATAEVVGTYQR